MFSGGDSEVTASMQSKMNLLGAKRTLPGFEELKNETIERNLIRWEPSKQIDQVRYEKLRDLRRRKIKNDGL